MSQKDDDLDSVGDGYERYLKRLDTRKSVIVKQSSKDEQARKKKQARNEMKAKTKLAKKNMVIDAEIKQASIEIENGLMNGKPAQGLVETLESPGRENENQKNRPEGSLAQKAIALEDSLLEIKKIQLPASIKKGDRAWIDKALWSAFWLGPVIVAYSGITGSDPSGAMLFIAYVFSYSIITIYSKF